MTRQYKTIYDEMRQYKTRRTRPSRSPRRQCQCRPHAPAQRRQVSPDGAPLPCLNGNSPAAQNKDDDDRCRPSFFLPPSITLARVVSRRPVAAILAADPDAANVPLSMPFLSTQRTIVRFASYSLLMAPATCIMPCNSAPDTSSMKMSRLNHLLTQRGGLIVARGSDTSSRRAAPSSGDLSKTVTVLIVIMTTGMCDGGDQVR